MDRSVTVIGALAITTGLLGLAGCEKSPPAVSAAPTGPEAAANHASQDVPTPERESWEIYRMQGKRIGYGNTTVRRTVEAEKPVVLTESLNHLAVKRAGQITEEDIRSQSVERPQGQLIRFSSELAWAPRRSARRAGFTATGSTSRPAAWPRSRRAKLDWLAV